MFARIAETKYGKFACFVKRRIWCEIILFLSGKPIEHHKYIVTNNVSTLWNSTAPLAVNLHEGNCASNRSSMSLSKLTTNTRFHRNYLTSMSASFTGGLRWGVGGSMSILSENIIHLIWLIGQFYQEQGFDIIREGVNTFLGMFT